MVFGFFVRGGNTTAGKTEAEVQKLQADHIANLKRLGGEGKLVLAGPCQDPSQRRRGIIVSTAKTLDAMKGWFDPDPFVQNDILRLELYPVKVRHSTMHKLKDDVFVIGEYSMLVVDSVPQVVESANPLSPDFEVFSKWPAAERPIFTATPVELGAGPFIAIFRKTDPEALRAKFATDKAVASGSYKALVYAQWMDKGLFDPE